MSGRSFGRGGGRGGGRGFGRGGRGGRYVIVKGWLVITKSTQRNGMHYVTISQIAYFFSLFLCGTFELIKGLAATKDHLLKLLVRYAIDLCMCVFCVRTYACFIL